MYTPRYAQNDDATAIKEFIRQHSFGILVSQSNQKILATHIPLLLSQDGTKLFSHVSRGNPQSKSFTPDAEVLAIFTGPHAYISSSWYDHENVPTWNYIAAHVYGKIQVLNGTDVHESLDLFMKQYEGATLDQLSARYVSEQVKGLVAFKIDITSVQATYKLSQNRDQKNHNNIVKKLEEQSDENAQSVAAAMKKRKF